MTTAASTYSTDQLDQMAAILERVNPSIRVPRDKLQQELLDLFYAVGRADDGSEEAAWFREAKANELSDTDLAERFRQIATADDPLAPEICFGIVLTKLNTVARQRWTKRKKPMNRPHPLRDVTSDLLTSDEIAEVREMAFHLASVHRSFVRRSRPNKFDQDTLLDGIADIYIRFAQLTCHPYVLPHSTNTHFINFAYAAMRPFFPLTEATKSAISKRWKRLKDKHGFFQPRRRGQRQPTR